MSNQHPYEQIATACDILAKQFRRLSALSAAQAAEVLNAVPPALLDEQARTPAESYLPPIDPSPQEEPEPQITLKEVNIRIGKIAQSLDELGKQNMARLIHSYGVPNIKFLDPQHYPDLIEKAEALNAG